MYDGKVVVIIPAFNEQDSIGSVIENIPRDCATTVEVLVIDDGSTDNTVKIANDCRADKIISHKYNKGLGKAFKKGIEEALELEGDIIVNIDADGQFNPADIPKLILPIINKDAEMTTCTRFAVKNSVPKMPLIKNIGNRIFTKLVSILTGQNFTDTQCGFRAYSREAALRLNLSGKFTYTQEVLLDLSKKNLAIIEVPCKVRGQREFGKSKMVSNPIYYAINSLLIITRVIRDQYPFRFFGFFGFVFSSIGTFFGILLLAHYKPYPFQNITPNLSLINLIIGFLLLMLALLADMNSKNKDVNEEILYLIKKNKKF